MSEHIAGRPVSASTYGNHKCRCAGCTAAHTQATYATWERRAKRLSCCVAGCERGAYAVGACRLHYQRRLRTGSYDAPPGRSGRATAAAQLIGVGKPTITRWKKKGLLDDATLGDTEFLEAVRGLAHGYGMTPTAALRTLVIHRKLLAQVDA
jgi:hypothetical protein